MTGQRFLLHTDHGSLTWLCNFKQPEGQLARWLERLQQFKFDTVHRKGKSHTNADALSRLPCRQCGRDSHATLTPTVVAATTLQPLHGDMKEGLRGAQLADPVLGPLLRGKETDKKPRTSEFSNSSKASRHLLQIWDQLSVSKGVLCRQSRGSHGSLVAQIVVPQILHEVLTDLHEGALGGHFEVNKTLARLKECFYWPGHYNDVCDWCRNCGTCASRKTPNHKAHAPLKSIETSCPLQLVAMDIVGPFLQSSAGNTHILVVADYFT